MTARDVSEAAAAGDVLALRIWNETTAMLASAIANILDVFNPDLIVLGGGVTNAGDMLLRPVREQALAWAMPPMRAAEIVLAELGSRLGVVSAAVVAFDRFGGSVTPPAARSDPDATAATRVPASPTAAAAAARRA